MERYVEIAIGHPGNRGVVIPLSDLPDYYGQPLFRSYYTFDKYLVEHFKIRKTIRNYGGKYYLDRIILDIDKGSNSNDYCLEKCRKFIDSMINDLQIPENYILPWFSGRGYHIQFPDIFGFLPSKDLPIQVKATMEKYFSGADDIYDGGRLIRVGLTPNEKTQNKLYKTPLTLKELNNLSVKEIQELASKPRADFPLKLSDEFKNPAQLLELVTPEKRPSAEKRPQFNVGTIATCIQKMWQEGSKEGSRHIKILRMASYYMRHGLPIEGTITMLHNWAQNMEPAEITRIVSDVYEKGFRYGCKDSLMDKYCASKCIYYPSKIKNQDPLESVMTSEQMESHYIARIRSDFSKTSFDLDDVYALGHSYKMLPGELVIILGDTGLGKTAFLQNIVAELNLSTLWLSLEVNAELMYRRFIQIAKGKTREEVEHHYASNDNSWSEAIEHIQVLTVAPIINTIRRLVAEVKPQILVIDTIDCIKVSKYVRDSMFKVDTIIDELRQIATLQNIIVMGVSHIPKSDSRAGSLDVHSGKHSSSIAQKSDKVIGIEGNKNNKTRSIRSLKARDEEYFKIICDFKGDTTFRFVQRATDGIR